MALGESKPPYNPKVFWSEVAADTALNALDGWTTVRSTRHGIMEADFPRGSAFMLGRRPSAGRYALYMGAIQAGEMLLSHRLERSRHRWLRLLGHGLLVGDAVSHAEGMVSNLSLRLPPMLYGRR
jgi:hypothetical protein